MSRPKRGTRGSHTTRPSWDEPEREPTPQAGFKCAHCGRIVAEQSFGTSQRNHCPYCLWSAHVDIRPGDRNALCRSPMEPITLWASEGEELRIVHRCTGCGVLKPNRVAGDDSEERLDELVRDLVRTWESTRGSRERDGKR